MQDELQQLAELQVGSSTTFKFFYEKYNPSYTAALKILHIHQIAEQLMQKYELSVCK